MRRNLCSNGSFGVALGIAALLSAMISTTNEMRLLAGVLAFFALVVSWTGTVILNTDGYAVLESLQEPENVEEKNTWRMKKLLQSKFLQMRGRVVRLVFGLPLWQG